MNAHPASDILRRPPREATWHRSLEILPSIFRENSTTFPRGQRARKIDQKSSRTSIESRSRVTHRGTQNRPKIAPGTLSGRPVLSKSVPKASRERFGSVSERPGEAQGAPKKPLWGSPRFFGVPGSPQKIPRREPTFFRDPQIAGTAEKATDFCTPGGATSSFLCAARSQTDFRSIFSRFSLDFRMFAQVVRGARSQRISIDWGSSAQRPTLTKVWPCHTFVRVGPVGANRLARARQPRKTVKIDPKIDPRRASAVSDEKPRKSIRKST